MPNPKVVVYQKPFCSWSRGVLAVFDKYGLDIEVKDVVKDQEAFKEMVSRTQQTMAPCVEIDGKMLVDVGGEEVEDYLVQNNLVDTEKTMHSLPIGKQECGSG